MVTDPFTAGDSWRNPSIRDGGVTCGPGGRDEGSGPQLNHFLFHEQPHAYLNLLGKLNIERMYRNINQHPSPAGLFCIADHRWGQKLSGNFFSHSCTTPTPSSVHTLQQLGLSISTLFAKLLTRVSNEPGCHNLAALEVEGRNKD